MASVNPFDPFGVGQAVVSSMTRAAEQTREAQRQAILNTAKADITAAYTAFANQPDRTAAENLGKAVEHYLLLCRSSD